MIRSWDGTESPISRRELRSSGKHEVRSAACSPEGEIESKAQEKITLQRI